MEGPNFIHGTEGNPLIDIAEKAGSTLSQYGSLTYFDNDAQPIDIQVQTVLYRKLWEYFDVASDYSRENDVDKNRNVGDFFKKLLEEDQELENNEMKHVMECSFQILAAYSACDLDKLSLKYLWAEAELPVGLIV